MGLETGSFISDLVATNPLGTDGKDQGDNHLRLIKSVLKGSLPNSDRAYHIPVALAAKVAAYPIAVADENSLIQVDATVAPLTTTLPTVASVPDGWVITVMKSDASANAVTVDGNGAETINGAANRSLANQYDTETYMRDGSEWKVISLNTDTAFVLGPTLTAIEALSPVANEMIYFTGADVAAVTTITLAGRNFIDDASVAAQQATLSLVPGIDVQVFDAVLEDLAAIASIVAVNEFIVGTGPGAYAHQSGATARDSIGLGTGDAVSFASLVLATDLPITEGGTGSSTAAAARIALGLEIGVDVQADLDVPSQAEAEAGTAAIERVWTAERVAQAIAALGATDLGLQSVQVFTAGGTWTKPADVKNIRAVVIGAGGGGNSGNATGPAGGGGGAAGGLAEEFIDVTGTASETVTIGTGGSVGGGNGGTSSLGSLLSATGGNGGGVASASTAGIGGASGVGSLGDINAKGADGSPGSVGTGSAGGSGGNGGSSKFGGGGRGGVSGAGTNAGNYGSGGGGGNDGAAGGTGSDGLVIVWEYK